MSDKANDLKSNASTKAEDTHSEGMDALDDAQSNAEAKTSDHRDRGGDARARADDALAGAKGMFNKLKQRVTGGN